MDAVLLRLTWRAWSGLVAGALALMVIGVVAYNYRPLLVVSGFVSRTLCSGVFVSGLSAAQVYSQSIRPILRIEALQNLVRYEVDSDRREVRASVAGFFERRAIADGKFGCLLEPPGASVERSRTRPISQPPAVVPLLPEGAAAVQPGVEGLRQAIDRAFAETGNAPLRQTSAVVIVHDGRIVGERYAPGYKVDTPILGYSVSKSVLNALVGVLVRQGRLSIADRAPVQEWNSPRDPRRDITIDMLLRMTTGLDVPETNREYDAVARMLVIERDMAQFAERASLVTAPGKVWTYTSGNSLILSRIVRDAVGGRAEDVLEFAHRELFGPLGMRTITVEFDSVGTPIGSTYVYASARDWARFGMLYLNDGVIDGKRILPEGWVSYSASQTLESPYAAGFWRGSKAVRERWPMPKDAFFASGWLGQRIMIIPSERLVIVCFGNSLGASAHFEGFMRLVAEVRRTLNQRATG